MYFYEMYSWLIEKASEFATMDDFWEYIGGHGLEQDVLLHMGMMTQEQIDNLDELDDAQCFVSDCFFRGIFCFAHRGDKQSDEELITDIKNAYPIDYVYDPDQIQEFMEKNGYIYSENKTFYLLKDISDGEPMEMLAFDSKFDRSDIQTTIHELTDKFYKQDPDRTGWVDGMYQGEYVLNGLIDKYNCDVIGWSNDDNLYY